MPAPNQPLNDFLNKCNELAGKVGYAEDPEGFLSYVVIHSATDRALFSYLMIGVLQKMAGFDDSGDDWVKTWEDNTDKRGCFQSVDMSELAEKVRENIRRAKAGESLVLIEA